MGMVGIFSIFYNILSNSYLCPGARTLSLGSWALEVGSGLMALISEPGSNWLLDEASVGGTYGAIW